MWIIPPRRYPRLRVGGERSRTKRKKKGQGRKEQREKERGEDVAEKWTMHVSQTRRDTALRSGRRLILFWKLGSRMTVTNSTPTDSLWRWPDPRRRILALPPPLSSRCLSRKVLRAFSEQAAPGQPLCIAGESRAFLFLAFINWPGYLRTPIESQGWAFNKAPRYRSSIFYASFIQPVINLPLCERSDLINTWRKIFLAILMGLLVQQRTNVPFICTG